MINVMLKIDIVVKCVLTPHGEKFKINPTKDNIIRLKMILCDILSIVKISSFGNNDLIILYPGNTRVKKLPNAYRKYMKG